MNKHAERFLNGFSFLLFFSLIATIMVLTIGVIQLTYNYWHILKWVWLSVFFLGLVCVFGWVQESLE